MEVLSPRSVDKTRTTILEAAQSILRERGFTELSTRDVARAAGVPLSQIHYHFRSKQGLVVAVFEHHNEQALDRQHRLYGDANMRLSEQWDLACDYLDDDMASGYVRVLMELWAAGWSDPQLAQVVREGTSRWMELLTAVARRAESRLGPLEPFRAEEIGALVATAFVGAEAFLLLGLENDRVPVRQALRRVGETIALRERNAS